MAPDLLQRDFSPAKPDKSYISDITYIWTSEGWLYLAVVIDLFSRMVVGASRMTRAIVTSALGMAIANRRPAAGLIHHSDRGVLYASGGFQRLLKQHGYQCSMSRKGNCWDTGSIVKMADNFRLTPAGTDQVSLC
jgi:putative transposase